MAADPTSWLEQFERALPQSIPNLRVADLDRLACPFLPICDPMIGDTVVYWNDAHLTARYSRSLAGPLISYLKANRLLPS